MQVLFVLVIRVELDYPFSEIKIHYRLRVENIRSLVLRFVSMRLVDFFQVEFLIRTELVYSSAGTWLIYAGELINDPGVLGKFRTIFCLVLIPCDVT